MFSNSFAVHLIASLIYLFFNLPNDLTGFKVTFFIIAYINLLIWLLRLILVFPIRKMLRKFAPSISKAYSQFSDLVTITICMLDSFLYSNQGLHIYDKVVLMTISNTNFNKDVGISTVTVISFTLFCLFLFLVKIFLAKFCMHFTFLNRKVYSLVAAIFLVTTIFNIFFFLPTSEVHSNSFPFYTVLRESPGQNPLRLDYNYQNLEISESDTFNKKNIVILTAESLRKDYFNKELAPLTLSLLEANNCQSVNAYSGGHTTEYGIFSILYGLYSFHFHDFKDNKVPPFIINFLNNNGYRTFGASASKLSSWNGSKFMLNQFNTYQEVSTDDVPNDDARISNIILEQAKSSKTPFFAFAFFNSTHHNYFFPDSFEKFTPSIEKDFNFFLNFDSNLELQNKIRNRYKNSIHYLDSILSRTISELLSVNKDTIIFITGDHGEEFWDENSHGHGKTSYINSRVNVPLWACGISPKQRTSFAHHSDIIPTIFYELGLKEIASKYFSGFSLTDSNFATRPVAILNGPQFPYNRNKAGIITTNYKFWVKKSTKRLFDFYKYRVTDHHDNNILDGSDSLEFREALNYLKNNEYKFLKED